MPTLVAVGAAALVAAASARGTALPLRELVFAFTAVVAALVASPLVLVVALPAMFGFWRVAAGGVDISVADIVVVIGAVAAVRYLPGVDRRLKQLLLVSSVYQVMIAIVVVASPTRAGAFEWAHRIALVGGAIAIGAAMARAQLVPWAVRLYYAVCAVFALEAVRVALATGLGHAYPFGMQKNPAGLLLAFGLLTLFVVPDLPQLPAFTRLPLASLLLAGLLATRSRGSMVALLLVALLWAFRSGHARRALPLVIAAGAALLFVIVITTESELEVVRNNPDVERFKGIGSRIEQNERTLEIWRENPVAGAGLRYFRDPAFAAAEPHNVVIHTLGEGGIVGAVALAVLLLGATWILWGLDTPLARLAKFALLMRFIAGLFDIFWVGGTGSMPWFLVGAAVAIGAQERAQEPALTP